jgi:hypothetical protein
MMKNHRKSSNENPEPHMPDIQYNANTQLDNLFMQECQPGFFLF